MGGDSLFRAMQHCDEETNNVLIIGWKENEDLLFNFATKLTDFIADNTEAFHDMNISAVVAREMAEGILLCETAYKGRVGINRAHFDHFVLRVLSQLPPKTVAPKEITISFSTSQKENFASLTLTQLDGDDCDKTLQLGLNSEYDRLAPTLCQLPGAQRTKDLADEFVSSLKDWDALM
eukprot:TRINITY_DN67121_c3_g10_i1.p1 TRINITY_DN67121_c3_g10~~TRINITY_DN67121_c3_g10_i1.p1  ORF type:complete len:178 (-),score=17.62 TRINITY_DN67121_c3_g10_i1:204-737(-)